MLWLLLQKGFRELIFLCLQIPEYNVPKQVLFRLKVWSAGYVYFQQEQ
jgi:hypothetical protein